ncbi:MAG: hypothetical protein ABIT36_07615, partial [Steroidobacteraceae bacterium]
MTANQPSLKDDSAVRELHPAPGVLPAIIALSSDPGLTHALQDLSGTVAGLDIVGSAEEFSEHLMRGVCGIALIDSAAVATAIPEFVDGIARQFPELVLVVAGGLAEQGQLAAHIGTGCVYRFVHKPASAQRLKLFIEAAARHQIDLIRQAVPPPEVQRAQSQAGTTLAGPGHLPPSLPLFLGVGLAVAVLIAGVLFFTLSGGKADKAPVAATTTPQADARAAREAVRAKSQAELDQLLSSAESALIEVRLDDAERLAVAAQQIAQRLATPDVPENTRVRFLQTQIAKERERVGNEEQRRSAIGARQARLAGLLKLAGERMQKGALVEPARDSALFYVESAMNLAPGDSDTGAARASLVKVLLAAAERNLTNRDIDSVRRLTDAAAAINAPQTEVDKLRRRADELRGSLAAGGGEPSAPVRQQASAPAPTPAPAQSVSASLEPAAPVSRPAEASSDVVPANLLTRLRYIEPQYPDSARIGRKSGWVDVEFTVAVDGTVKNLT